MINPYLENIAKIMDMITERQVPYHNKYRKPHKKKESERELEINHGWQLVKQNNQLLKQNIVRTLY